MLNKLKPTIAVIDSGVGGISVLNALIKKFGAGNYIYFADNLYMPYGNKRKEFVKKRVNYIINLLKNNYLVDYIFVACNTASSVIDTNDKTIIKMQFNPNNLYFATNLTKQSLPGYNIIADSSLAKQIENNINNSQAIEKIVKRHIKKYKLASIESFVLGCTHFELVSELFKKYCPNSKIINNSNLVVNNFNINFNTNETTILFLQTKNSKSYLEKLKTLTEI